MNKRKSNSNGYVRIPFGEDLHHILSIRALVHLFGLWLAPSFQGFGVLPKGNDGGDQEAPLLPQPVAVLPLGVCHQLSRTF